MNVSPSSRSLTTSPSGTLLRAFTLIELLVVISIIAILMGLLFPAAINVANHSKNLQARNDVTQIVAAVKQYEVEYGHLPAVTSDTRGPGDTLVGDTAAGASIDNAALFNTLRAIPEGRNADHQQNPRRIVFFEGRSVKDPEHPRAGFADRAGEKKGCLFDPWGQQYSVVLDTNYDRSVDLADQYADFATAATAPRVVAAAFSLGKDGKLGERGNKKVRGPAGVSDDVLSWQ